MRRLLEKRIISRRKGLLLLALLAVLAVVATAERGRADASISATLTPSRFSVDTGATLVVNVNGSRSADIHIPSVSGLTFSKNGQSTQIQIVNGSFSSSLSTTYLVQADKPGKYTIPPISISVNGSTVSTQPIDFEVTQAGSAPAMPGNPAQSPTRLHSGEADKLAFLQVSEVRDKSWVGQVIPIRIKAYFRQGIKVSQIGLPVLNGDGFVMQPLSQKPPQSEETVNGIDYSVLTWDSTISAVKEGKQSLNVELQANLLLPQRRPRLPGFDDQDLFQDDFFQNFFGRYTSRTVKVTSDPITIEARQLPTADQPPGFSGAIGHFNLSVQAKPTSVGVGDPISLTMTVSGSGNFDRVDAPKFPEDDGFKTYPPSADFKPGDNATQGSKKFDQAIIVKDGKVSEIPPISFTYFNPSTDKYVTLSSPPIPLTVKQSVQPQIQAPASAPAAPAPAASVKSASKSRGIEGLAPIQLQLGRLQKRFVPLFAKAWFDTMAAVCILLLATVFLWKVRSRYLQKNPAVRRKKEMHELYQRQMRQIEEAAAAGDGHRYLSASRNAVREILGRQWGIEPTSITLADLQARLDPASGLITVFAAAEQAAYANLSLSAEQIRQYTDNLRKELADLI